MMKQDSSHCVQHWLILDYQFQASGGFQETLVLKH